MALLSGVALINKSKTHCNKGHEFTQSNTAKWSNSKGGYRRGCVACMRIRTAEIAKRRAALRPALAPFRERLAKSLSDNSIPEPNSGCLLWIGAVKPGGYGNLGIKPEGRTYIAHRAAYEVAYGTIPTGLKVLHKCDNPPCINPLHLFLGTQLDNIRDCVSKGRHVSRRKGDRRIQREGV